MTEARSSDMAMDQAALDPEQLEVAQARLLNERTRSSAISVFCLLTVYSATLTFSAPVLHVAIWFCSAVFAIGLTFVLPWCFRESGIHASNAKTYLRWHTAISCLTGAIWGVGPAALTDLQSEVSLFATGVIVLSITLGGISPQSAYRRSYVGLATFAMLPYATWILVMASWPYSGVGVGVLLAYAFFMSASARVEIGTRDMLATKQNKLLIKELSLQRNALQRANEEKTRFLAATSHDLAQPLHAQGFYLAALREMTRDAEQMALLGKIEASWRGLGNLLDGLVDVSRLDAGVIVPDLRPVNIAALVRRVGDEFAAAAANRGITVEVEADEAWAESDALILTRILRNLVSNAVKFTEAGGAVYLSAKVNDGKIDLLIRDTGCGIPPDKLRLVFEEYVQLGNPERDREKGLGLGLSIVRRLLQLLDLQLDMKSMPGEGTRAALTLKLLDEKNIRPEDLDGHQAARASTVGNLCVLLVDNEDAIRAGMTTVLTSWGCQVFSAGSGAEVFDILDHAGVTPQVLLVDQRLGDGETGIAVIEQVRDEINETVPAIIMTGDIETDHASFGVAHVSILHKPVEPEHLHRILHRISLAAAETAA
jgi:signal transduction histidine kinase